MEREEMQVIESRIGYRFRNGDLLQQAFVRRSYAAENGGEHNEVLEFIGDKVLDFAVTKLLTERYGRMTDGAEWREFSCELDEAALSQRRASLVCKKTLSQRIDELGFADYLIMGRGDQRKHAEREPSVKEDLFEAILGAVALDCGWNGKTLQEVVEKMLRPELLLAWEEADSVSAVWDWTRGEYGCEPESAYENREQLSRVVWTYDEICKKVETEAARRNPLWRCKLVLHRVFDKVFVGGGETKTEALLDSCKAAYAYLEKNDLIWTIRDEIKNPNRAEAISQLEILARRGYFSIPTYDFVQRHNADGTEVWHCTCCIAEEERYFTAQDSSKKEAKKTAAHEMLLYMLGL